MGWNNFWRSIPIIMRIGQAISQRICKGDKLQKHDNGQKKYRCMKIRIIYQKGFVPIVVHKWKSIPIFYFYFYFYLFLLRCHPQNYFSGCILKAQIRRFCILKKLQILTLENLVNIHTKGQLNSKWIHEVIISPKMPTKNLKDFCPTL